MLSGFRIDLFIRAAVRERGNPGSSFESCCDRFGRLLAWVYCDARLELFAQRRNGRYAARWVVMSRDSSRSVVPREISERISRSRETDGSPASILATRDWLD